jgi:hypothetical protein
MWSSFDVRVSTTADLDWTPDSPWDRIRKGW